MGLFARPSRSGSVSIPEAGNRLGRVRRGIPSRFVAWGESLVAGIDTISAAEVAGRLLAEDGTSLAEALEHFRDVARDVAGRDPSFAETHALSTAWSEATLAYLHQLSCEDPLTGLATLAHIRGRVSELYRCQTFSGSEVPDSHALVLVEISGSLRLVDDPSSPRSSLEGTHGITAVMRMARLGEMVRTVFSGPDPVGRLGVGKIVAVVERDDRLGIRVGLLRRLIEPAESTARVWIEGLPSTDLGSAQLFDELSRS